MHKLNWLKVTFRVYQTASPKERQDIMRFMTDDQKRAFVTYLAQQTGTKKTA